MCLIPALDMDEALASCHKNTYNMEERMLCEMWLTAHNDRRETYHRRHGKLPSLLQWDATLAKDAQEAAEVLASGQRCDVFFNTTITAQGQLNYGIAGSAPRADWDMDMPDRIMAFVWDDHYNEIKNNPGYLGRINIMEALQFTQAAWYHTHYVGCGSAYNSWSSRDGDTCFYSVCRYHGTGNCGILTPRSALVDDWEDLVLNGPTTCANWMSSN